ncbi:helix-turn-helix transcriptional regulator [Streptacidiphilus sp. N1-10]|uniref:Helix-turn-helix transcriptional regulator n=1 Tax=Streptacidiphilus jeojiensis TaxID=3229225 RepID=A0ABV6Y122_9ACTN
MKLPIGARVRHFRGTRQQDVIAGLAGISVDYYSQIERGLRIPTIAVLHRIAQELGVPVAALLSEGTTVAVTAEDTAAPSIARALMSFGPPRSTDPAGPEVLRERVEAAWRSWQSSPTRFTDAADVLPDLITDTEHAVRAHRTGDSERRRETLRVSADLYFLLRSYLRRAGRTDLSMMAADRAVRAAEDADDPLRIAAAQWNLGHALLAAGDPDAAEQVARKGSEQLKHRAQGGDADCAAMAGALQLVTVVASARRKDWWAARDRLRSAAAPAAKQAGEGNVMWTVFGPTNVALHAMSIEMEAGEASEALHDADQIDTSRLPSLERRFTFLLEVARCHDLRREDPAVLLHLLQAEQLAPEDLSRTELARTMVVGLMRRARAMQARQAEQLAGRMDML